MVVVAIGRGELGIFDFEKVGCGELGLFDFEEVEPEADDGDAAEVVELIDDFVAGAELAVGVLDGAEGGGGEEEVVFFDGAGEDDFELAGAGSDLAVAEMVFGVGDADAAVAGGEFELVVQPSDYFVGEVYGVVGCVEFFEEGVVDGGVFEVAGFEDGVDFVDEVEFVRGLRDAEVGEVPEGLELGFGGIVAAAGALKVEKEAVLHAGAVVGFNDCVVDNEAPAGVAHEVAVLGEGLLEGACDCGGDKVEGLRFVIFGFQDFHS